MLGELYCNFFHHHYGLKVVKPRFFNSYGPGEVPGQYRNVIPNFIYWAMKGLPLPITGTGEETRDFTYVGDLVDGLLRAGYFEEAVGQSFKAMRQGSALPLPGDGIQRNAFWLPSSLRTSSLAMSQRCPSRRD